MKRHMYFKQMWKKKIGTLGVVHSNKKENLQKQKNRKPHHQGWWSNYTVRRTCWGMVGNDRRSIQKCKSDLAHGLLTYSRITIYALTLPYLPDCVMHPCESRAPSLAIKSPYACILFCWSVVDLQCCADRCKAKWLSFILTCILFYILFHCCSPQEIGCGSLCRTGGPHCLSILNVILCIHQPPIPCPSLFLSPLPFGNHKSALWVWGSASEDRLICAIL